MAVPDFDGIGGRLSDRGRLVQSVSGPLSFQPCFLSLALREYLKQFDWTGRQLRSA